MAESERTRKVAVLTAIYDDYDSLKPVLPQDTGMDIEWICVTDNQALLEDPKGWDVRYHPRPGIHPNMAAKHPKMFPWTYTTATESVWIDASYRVSNPYFVWQALSFANPIAQFSHPWRQCIYSEAQVSKGIAKYGGHSFDDQTTFYQNEDNHPPNWGSMGYRGDCT